MKGLLLKDFYMMVKYCKAYLFFIILFVALTITDRSNGVSSNSLFFVFYPCILVGLIPVTLLSYDERSNWNEYSGTLPYSKAQLVSAKYLIGMIVFGALFVLSGIAQAVKMSINGTFAFDDYLVLMEMILIISCVTSSFMLPVIFKMGTEKGRITYLAMIVLICVGCFVAADCLNSLKLHFQIMKSLPLEGILLIICIASIALYALSWYLSIVIYEKREER